MAVKLSIVIPAYNEESRIGTSLHAVLDFVLRQPHAAEVIVVNDGSNDLTADVVNSHVTEYKIAGVELRMITNTPNRGKGYSVKRGVTEARGEMVLFTDADLSSPITEATKLMRPLEDGRADIVFGSRALDRSLIAVRQPLARDFGGRIFNLLMRLITGLPFKDTQCGFKAFRRRLALPAVQLQRIQGFGFDPELLYIARKQGLKLMEVPVVWSHSEGSRVSFLKDSLKMFADLVLIRLNDLRGRYSMPASSVSMTGDNPARDTADACDPTPLAAGIGANSRDEDKA
jgi:glycosyltransferase involved in cell wall biosynthesis